MTLLGDGFLPPEALGMAALGAVTALHRDEEMGARV